MGRELPTPKALYAMLPQDIDHEGKRANGTATGA